MSAEEPFVIQESATEPVEPKDASTVLLLRGNPAEPEIFMVRRTARAAFMANAMVFPGGRLDESDLSEAMAQRCALERSEAATRLGMEDGIRALGLYVAALRETWEEAGVLLARRNGQPVTMAEPDEAHRFSRLREQLNAGELTFLEVLEQEELTLSVDQLGYFSHWVTPGIERRRYDTRFFVTRAPEHQRPLHDANETTASAWLTAADALAEYERENIQLAPPTLRILMEIAENPKVVDPDAAPVHPKPICPQPHFEDDLLHLLLPGDPAFDPPGTSPNRVTLEDGRWLSVGRGSRLL
jgi:8-oxo-dGTP pyrophosphatase MutT (NUDIX family)